MVSLPSWTLRSEGDVWPAGQSGRMGAGPMNRRESTESVNRGPGKGGWPGDLQPNLVLKYALLETEHTWRRGVVIFVVAMHH